MKYIYLGDRLTDAKFKGRMCAAIMHNGKCIRGKNANMLVSFSGEKVIVLARRLRKMQ